MICKPQDFALSNTGYPAVFTAVVIVAAVFFHLAFKQWSFLQFSDPSYRGLGPYIALGLIILVVLGYSAFITAQHFKRGH